uniref:Mitochondrial thiamine pyrophosphate carrier n=1 Tax=Syphacia muris TaxID=451379 RepID=A0A0N5APE0_9BILA
MVGYGSEKKHNTRELTTNDYGEAGILSGIATRCIIQPLDVLKIRFQLQEEAIHGLKMGKYKGIHQAIMLIFKEEGITAFWKGHVPAQCLSAVYGLVQFTSFELFTEKAKKHGSVFYRSYVHLKDNKIVFTVTQRETTDFLCGAAAGCSAMVAAAPMDVIRTRLIAQGNKKVYYGMLNAIHLMWTREGIRSFFRGLSPSLVHIAPYTGLQFSLFNWFSGIWENLTGKEETQGALISGALSGAAAKTILYPLDMVRHRLQLRGFQRLGFGRTSEYRTMVGTFVHVIKHESFFGLFKGLWPAILKAAASTGFAFLFYDVALDMLRSV